MYFRIALEILEFLMIFYYGSSHTTDADCAHTDCSANSLMLENKETIDASTRRISYSTNAGAKAVFNSDISADV
jgi:hypothetical protein|tara:strand:+ start:397 stop:618 length:222 start_codon:yes stop_codon:yes gene_type:complete